MLINTVTPLLCIYLYTEDYVIHNKYVVYKDLYAQHLSKPTFAASAIYAPFKTPHFRRRRNLPDFATQMLLAGMVAMLIGMQI